MDDPDFHSDFLPQSFRVTVILVSVLGSTTMIAGFLLLLYCCNRRFRDFLWSSCSRRETEFVFGYDPFVVYHGEDEDWVNDILLENIGDLVNHNKSQTFVVDDSELKCKVTRFWTEESMINPMQLQQLPTPVVLFVLTNRFLVSKWCTHPDYRQLMEKFIRKWKKIAIVINMLEPPTSNPGADKSIPKPLRTLIQKCFQWADEPAFWDDFKGTLRARLNESYVEVKNIYGFDRDTTTLLSYV